MEFFILNADFNPVVILQFLVRSFHEVNYILDALRS